MVLLNATLAVSLYLRAINTHGAAAVAMLFAVIPAVAAVLSWLMLGQRPDAGVAVGLLAGALACWLNSRASGRRRPAEGSAESASTSADDVARDEAGRSAVPLRDAAGAA
jgi:hypothetical protein